VLTTHKHWDHAKGNEDMVKEFEGIQIVGGEKDDVKACTHPVADGDKLEIGGMTIECMHTPCHTKGHTCYYVTSSDEEEKSSLERSINDVTGHPQVTGFNRLAFTGDTLFIGTVGKFFEGNAKQMHNNLERLHALPADTQIFPGHEYTLDSLNFCKTMDTKNSILDTVIEESKKLLEDGYPTIPRTITEIQQVTIFCRYKDPDVQKLAGADNEVDTLGAIREAKDTKTHLGCL
jgi:hydroxyacylglutathione hydrolase